MKDFHGTKFRVLFRFPTRRLIRPKHDIGGALDGKPEFLPIKIVTFGHPKSDPESIHRQHLRLKPKGLIRWQQFLIATRWAKPQGFQKILSPVFGGG